MGSIVTFTKSKLMMMMMMMTMMMMMMMGFASFFSEIPWCFLEIVLVGSPFFWVSLLLFGWFTGIWHEGHVVAMMPHALSIKAASGPQGATKRLYLVAMHQIDPELLTDTTERSGSWDFVLTGSLGWRQKLVS